MPSNSIPNILTRRRLLEGLAAAAALTLSPLSSRTLFASAPVPKASQPTPTGPVTSASITVAAIPSGAITSNFAGLSYEKTQTAHSFFRTTNKNLIALFKLLGPSLLRIGGDSNDKTVWTPSGSGVVYKQITPSEVAATAAFVKATGWKCLYSVNLGGSANGSTSPALAAAEVKYAVEQFGDSLFGIEIGNEPDSYNKKGRQYDGKPWDLATYETLWNQYRDAILAVAPHVLITGPAAGHLADWTIPFTKHQTKSKISLLTDHYYYGHPNSGFSVEKMLRIDPVLLNNLKMMREAQAITGIPFRLGETNSSTGGSAGVSDAYAASLWTLDFLFTCALGGATGVNFHGGKSVPYTAIADDGESTVTAIAPEFYGMLLFTLAGTGILYPATISAGSLNVTAYAIKTATGTSIVILNKDTTQNLNLTLTLPQSAKTAELLTLTQSSAGASTPSLAALSGVTIQSSAVATDGKFTPAPAYTLATSGAAITCSVPALSAVLIKTTE